MPNDDERDLAALQKMLAWLKADSDRMGFVSYDEGECCVSLKPKVGHFKIHEGVGESFHEAVASCEKDGWHP
jgi:hypothetical protein